MALGINIIGAESPIPPMTQGRVMPLLQDTRAANVVAGLGLAKDDVVVLDRQGRLWRHQATMPGFTFFESPGRDSIEAWVRRAP